MSLVGSTLGEPQVEEALRIATFGKHEEVVRRIVSMIPPSTAVSFVAPSFGREQIRRVLFDCPSVLILTDSSTEDIQRIVSVCKEVDSKAALVSVEANLKSAYSAIAAGADSVVLLQPTFEQTLLAAVESGRNAALRRNQLERRIEKLETRALHRRVIGQAVELLADRRKMPSLESRRLLRREARKRRCTMFEIANIVIEASQLLTPDVPDPGEEVSSGPSKTRSKQ